MCVESLHATSDSMDASVESAYASLEWGQRDDGLRGRERGVAARDIGFAPTQHRTPCTQTYASST